MVKHLKICVSRINFELRRAHLDYIYKAYDKIKKNFGYYLVFYSRNDRQFENFFNCDIANNLYIKYLLLFNNFMVNKIDLKLLLNKNFVFEKVFKVFEMENK
jgi:hypothetical protein